MKKWLIILAIILAISLLSLLPSYAAETDYYTATTARAQVRALLNETTASFWTDVQIDAWIVEAAQDISARTLCIQKTTDLTLATGTQDYATEDYTIKVLGCLYKSPDIEGVAQGYIGLKRITFDQIADLPHSRAGPPKYFYRFSEDGTGKIGVFPLPSATENGEAVKVIYAVSTNDITEIPQLLQSASFWYTASQAYRKEHRYTEANQMYEMYLEKLNSLRSDIYNVRPEIRTQ